MVKNKQVSLANFFRPDQTLNARHHDVEIILSLSEYHVKEQMPVKIL